MATFVVALAVPGASRASAVAVNLLRHADRGGVVTQAMPAGPAPADAASAEAMATAQQTIEEVIARSYPGLTGVDIHVRSFRSASDYFRTSFSVWRFLFGLKMRYAIEVNPEVRPGGAPADGVEAILAHELAHVEDFASGKRLRLLGLVRLLRPRSAARFERRTDLRAIELGYGRGLQAYRRWLYDHIPEQRVGEKRRNYFSPEEIDTITNLAGSDPVLYRVWHDHVPMGLEDIRPLDADLPAPPSPVVR